MLISFNLISIKFLVALYFRTIFGLFCSDVMGAIHSTKISGNFSPKLNGSVLFNRKSFEKTGPPFEVDHFSRSDRLEFWLNGSHPIYHAKWTSFLAKLHSLKELCRNIVFFVEYYGFPEAFFKSFLYKLNLKNCLTS